jgi:hypothetical protein
MSGYRPQPGDFIIVERQDSGRQFTAIVDHVTKGGNVQFKAPKIGAVGWAKVRTANIRNERIVRKATSDESTLLMRQMEGG